MLLRRSFGTCVLNSRRLKRPLFRMKSFGLAAVGETAVKLESGLGTKCLVVLGLEDSDRLNFEMSMVFEVLYTMTTAVSVFIRSSWKDSRFHLIMRPRFVLWTLPAPTTAASPPRAPSHPSNCMKPLRDPSGTVGKCQCTHTTEKLMRFCY